MRFHWFQPGREFLLLRLLWKCILLFTSEHEMAENFNCLLHDSCATKFCVYSPLSKLIKTERWCVLQARFVALHTRADSGDSRMLQSFNCVGCACGTMLPTPSSQKMPFVLIALNFYVENKILWSCSFIKMQSKHPWHDVSMHECVMTESFQGATPLFSFPSLLHSWRYQRIRITALEYVLLL